MFLCDVKVLTVLAQKGKKGFLEGVSCLEGSEKVSLCTHIQVNYNGFKRKAAKHVWGS